jgi:hypothetical protein
MLSRQNRLNLVTLMALTATVLISGCSALSEEKPDLKAIQLASPSPSPSSQTTQTEEDLEANSPVSDSFAELEIEDQAGLGKQVEVDEVRLSLGLSFLVITTRDGTVLGYATATPDSQPVSVSLSSQIDTSQELIGILFLDNGDRKFSTETDSRIRDDEGELVEEDFDYTIRKN